MRHAAKRRKPPPSLLLILCALLAAPLSGHAADAADGLVAAIAAARPGAVVTVSPGVHRVNLVLDKPITLRGQAGAVLDGGGQGDVVLIKASHVSLSNLTIRNSGRDLTAMNAGIVVAASVHAATIAHNRITGSLFGIYLNGASGVVVENNVIRGIARLRVADRGDGIHLWNDSGCTVRGNDIDGTRDGIYDYASHHDLIAGNTVHGVRYGVHQMFTHHETLRRNRIVHSLAGLALMSSDHLSVTANRLFDDTSYGILFNYVTYSDITGNDISDVIGELGPGGAIMSGAEGKGVFLYNSEFNTVRGNRIARSTIGIHVTAGSEDNTVSGNVFLGNRTAVKYVQNAAEEWSVDGRGNYWGNYLGWDLNGDGIGDVPYRPNDGVDVLLWEYPEARALMSSPAILLLRYVQRSFPVFSPPSIQDSHPLMRIPANWRHLRHAERD